MNIKTVRLLILIMAGVILIWPNMAEAQTHEQMRVMERLASELELTEEVLVRAFELVRSTDDETALLLIRVARERQNWARDQFLELRREFRLRLAGMALIATQKAREQARNAIASVRRVDRHQGVVSRRLDRAEELLRRAHDLIGEHHERERLESMLQVARNSLMKAREFYNNAQYRPALKMASQAIHVAERLLRGTLDSSRDMAEFERRQAGLNRRLDEAKSRLADCDWVRPQLEAAEKAYFLALELADDNHPRRALKQLEQAKGLINQAVGNCRGLADIVKNLQRLQNRQQQLAEAGEQLTGQKEEAFEALLLQSREQIALARGFADQKQFDAAKISVQAALQAMNRAQRIIEGI